MWPPPSSTEQVIITPNPGEPITACGLLLKNVFTIASAGTVITVQENPSSMLDGVSVYLLMSAPHRLANLSIGPLTGLHGYTGYGYAIIVTTSSER